MSRASSTGVRQRFAHHRFLRLAARHRDAADGVAILIRRGRDQQGTRVQAELLCGAPRHQHERRRAFRTHIAIRAGVKGATPSARRQHVRLTEPDPAFRTEHCVRAADHGVIAFSLPQTLRREMQRHQRRRTGRVHREARTAQIEQIRDPVCRDGKRAADVRVAIDRAGVAAVQIRVIAVRDADENAGAGAGEFFRRQTRVLERFPSCLQQPAMLRIETRRLARGNAEKRGVDAVRIFHKAAPTRHHAARRGGIRMMKARRVPTRRRHFGDGIHAVAQQRPKRQQANRHRRENGRPSRPGRVVPDWT